jgi:L-amino acid N-acyltransferase YncA
MQIVRAAGLEDAEKILEIYKPYVSETAISFETEVPSLQEFRGRMASITGKFPWLVYERDGEILGYAYAGPFRSRCAYEWSVEASVYVQHGVHRSGIGKALYGPLLETLKGQGAVNVIGGVTLPNEGSIGLHEYFGFEKVGVFKDAGYKLGKWWDVGYWQLQFTKPEHPPHLRAPGV